MSDDTYLTGFSDDIKEYGFSKVLLVRKEIIHLKHILTQIFVRNTININLILAELGMTLEDYMCYFTNKMRKVHKISRNYQESPTMIVKTDDDSFFKSLELRKGLNNVIVLDYDQVVTDKNFHSLYKLCIQRAPTIICSANPTITPEWFNKYELPLPHRLYSMKGSAKKIQQLIDISKKYDNMFYIDDEERYLDIVWIFGIKTYQWTGHKIKQYSLNPTSDPIE